MQSEQVLLPLRPISHDIHLGILGNTAMHAHQEVLNRESYNIFSNNNMTNFKLYPPTLKNLEAKSKAPTKRITHQDPVHSSSSHSVNNSASDEAEDQHVIDERKQRRMISNRESARRSRMRKQKHLDELRAQVAHMRAENRQLMNKFDIVSQHYNQIIEENRLLKSQAFELNHQLQQLHQAISAQSPFVLRDLGFDDLPCTAAHLRAEPIQHLVSSDLLL
eukprot:Gb_20759 [translate_table: standard]